MSNINSHDKTKFNIGKWVAARIYSDDRNNACSCGGKFATYIEIKRRDKKSIFLPECSSCRQPPERYRIRAKLKDGSGKPRNVFVRKTIDGEYLTDPDTVLDVFKRVEADEKMGKFRYSDYDRDSVKKKDLFKNVVTDYLRVQSLRKDLSPYSLDSKRKYSRILVEGIPADGLTGFGDVSIHDIEGYHVEDFKLGLKSHTNQTMCLGEMKTILNWAQERYKLARVPRFEVPSSKKRKSVPDLEQARAQVIPAIENEIHREAIRMLAQYGLRPSEVRAIQYEQIDIVNERITIDRHFSKTTLLMGRKSAAEGEDTSVLVRKLTPELKTFIKSRPWPINQPKKFLFTNTVGKPMGVKDLSQTWRETLKKLKLPHVEMYGLRGAKITEVIKKAGKDSTVGRDFAGHTDVRTTQKHYDFNDRNVDEFIG
jgi:integrase